MFYAQSTGAVISGRQRDRQTETERQNTERKGNTGTPACLPMYMHKALESPLRNLSVLLSIVYKLIACLPPVFQSPQPCHFLHSNSSCCKCVSSLPLVVHLPHKRNSNKFWDVIKNARQRKRNQPEIDISDWERHFKSVFTSPGKEQTQTLANPENDANETFVPELDNPITEHEVRQAIKNLKTGKACGLDDICGGFLKHADSLVVPFLTNYFNRL